MVVSSQYIPEIKIPYPQQENPTIKKVKVLTELGLPFLSLYKPASPVLSYGAGILGVTQGLKGLVGSENRVQSAVAVAKGVADIATTYFQNRAVMIANGMVELTQGIHNLYVAPPEERMTHVVKCLSIAVHLAAQVHQSTPQWMILSLIIQALSNFYHAYRAYLVEKKPEEFQWEKALTVVAKTVMGLIRLYQAHELYEEVKLRKEVEEFLASEEEELITAEVIEDELVEIEIEEVVNVVEEQPEELQIVSPTEDVTPVSEPVKVEDPSRKFLSQTLTIVEDESDHPLKNLVQQIEAKRVVLIDPVTGNKYDFGAYFHGYGNRLVKGSNLRFNHKVSKDGSVVTELMFKVNRFYQSHMQQKVEQLAITSPQVDTEIEYSIPWIFSKNHKEMVQEIKEILFSKPEPFTGFKLSVKDVGSLEVQQSLVKVALAGDRGIKDFQRFLSAFGLDEAVQPSAAEDIEKIKLGFLFKFFNPLEAYKLQKEPSFANFTSDEMKQKMISKAPAMENYLNKYQVQPIELLPGYVRYSIPIDTKVYELGGRALTAIITGGDDDNGYDDDDDEREIPTDLPRKELEKLVNIVKHGMFSEEMKIASKVGQGGLGGNESVFTQMVWEMDVKDRKKLEKMGYARHGLVRLYFSLKALNRGSYQYNRDLFGVRKGAAYKQRKNIIDFITSFPFWSSEAKYYHEFMVPDRILPEEILGMSVPSEYMKEQLLDYYRKYQIIQVDAQGIETINGIVARAFISVDPRIPVDIIQRCGNPEEL